MSRLSFLSVYALCLCFSVVCPLRADEPVLSYLFPAGGRRGTAVDVRAGGLFLHGDCGLTVRGPACVTAPARVKAMPAKWFEGPVLPLPESQQQEDYPRDLALRLTLAADAAVGPRLVQATTGQGVTAAVPFLVGDLPEVVEDELPGEPVAVPVSLPITVNGRCFPREDVDDWSFAAKAGQTFTATAANLGTVTGVPRLDAHLAFLDADGLTLAESDDDAVRFTAPADGTYRLRVRDVRYLGSPSHVYRLTLTDGPHVDRVYPLGDRRGTDLTLELAGANLPAGPATVKVPAAGEATFRVGGGDPVPLDADDLPELREEDRPGAVTAPAVLNGRVLKPGEADAWVVNGVKGVPLELRLRALALGSRLQGVVTVTGPDGKQAARAEADADDPVLTFTPPADGPFTVTVADRFRSRGGPAFAYRLRVAPPGEPDFRLHVALPGLTVLRGGAKPTPLTVTAERLGGLAVPIELTFDGLPDGVTLKNAVIPAGQRTVNVELREAKPATTAGAYPVRVRGTARLPGKAVTREATVGPAAGPDVGTVLVGIGLATPFKIVGDYQLRLIPRGTTYVRHYRIERNGYEGPVEIGLSDRQSRHLQGATGPTFTVPPGQSEFDYPIDLPPWMETGRTCRVCVMGTGTARDLDGTEHAVSYHSVAQNDQIIAVVEPSRLAMEADRTSLSAGAGKAAVTVKVSRGKGLEGPARVELVVPTHVKGVKAEPVTVAADETRGTMTIEIAADAGPFTMPLLLRAAVTEGGRPVIAEVKLEVVPGR